MSGDFNPEQKRYLEGFVAGMRSPRPRVRSAALRQQRVAQGLGLKRRKALQPNRLARRRASARARPRAQSGGKLSEQEKSSASCTPSMATSG